MTQDELKKAKTILTKAHHEIEYLKYENQRLKGILYRSIMKNGNQLSNKFLEEHEINNVNFKLTKDLDGNFVVIVENQKTLKNE